MFEQVHQTLVEAIKSVDQFREDHLLEDKITKTYVVRLVSDFQIRLVASLVLLTQIGYRSKEDLGLDLATIIDRAAELEESLELLKETCSSDLEKKVFSLQYLLADIQSSVSVAACSEGVHIV